jgi:hypothetical protein
VTRKQIETAIDRFLGGSTTELIIRELRMSISRAREARTNPRPLAARPIRDFVDTLTRRNMTESVLKRVRLAVDRAQRMR